MDDNELHFMMADPSASGNQTEHVIAFDRLDLQTTINVSKNRGYRFVLRNEPIEQYLQGTERNVPEGPAPAGPMQPPAPPAPAVPPQPTRLRKHHSRNNAALVARRGPPRGFASLGMPMLAASAPWTIFHHDNNELTGISKRRKKYFR